jgi:hypothetical protein
MHKRCTRSVAAISSSVLSRKCKIPNTSRKRPHMRKRDIYLKPCYFMVPCANSRMIHRMVFVRDILCVGLSVRPCLKRPSSLTWFSVQSLDKARPRSGTREQTGNNSDFHVLIGGSCASHYPCLRLFSNPSHRKVAYGARCHGQKGTAGLRGMTNLRRKEVDRC